MKLNINTIPLTNANAGRGVGQYTRMLIEAIRTHTDIELVDSWEQADVVHYPFFDLFFLTLPLHKPKPTVVTVHDVIPLLYPDHYPKGLRGAAKQLIQTMSLSGAHRIVTDSDCSTADVVRLLKQPQEKVETVYLAPDPGYSPASKAGIETVKSTYGLNKPYFLYVGDINYNKNLPELLRFFSKLGDEYLLVMVTKPLRRSNPAADFLWKQIDALGIENRLRILNEVPLEPLDEMRALYSGALWYVQPSLYEGFGLPVLEAQTCGCPVISTLGGSLKEICNDSCFNFELIGSAPEVDRNPFIQLGYNNVARFSWEKAADLMSRVYTHA
jgi:glycosyltransferase involved in cell wall biosynthesis